MRLIVITRPHIKFFGDKIQADSPQISAFQGIKLPSLGVRHAY